jgi:hypothetical protein
VRAGSRLRAIAGALLAILVGLLVIVSAVNRVVDDVFRMSEADAVFTVLVVVLGNGAWNQEISAHA